MWRFGPLKAVSCHKQQNYWFQAAQRRKHIKSERLFAKLRVLGSPELVLTSEGMFFYLITEPSCFVILTKPSLEDFGVHCLYLFIYFFLTHRMLSVRKANITSIHFLVGHLLV